MVCPLCHSNHLEIISSIPVDFLSRLYSRFYGADIDHLFDEQHIRYLLCQQCDLRFFDPVVTGDETFYNALQKFPWYYMDEKTEFAAAKEYIAPGDTLLEVGCGKGAFANMLPESDYMGLDLSQKAKDMALHNGVRVECETIENHSGSHEAAYSVVCSFQVLEHVSDPFSFIKSSVACLKPGGKMIIGVPSEDSFMKYSINETLNMPPHHATRWSDKALRSIGDIFGLRLTHIIHERVQPYHMEQYLFSYYMNIVYSLFGIRQNMLDESFVYKLATKAVSRIARLMTKNVAPEMLPNGHTVLAVYTKPMHAIKAKPVWVKTAHGAAAIDRAVA